MSHTALAIFSSIVFILSLFLFGNIFHATTAVFSFLIVEFLLELFDYFRRLAFFPVAISLVIRMLMSLLFSISTYSIIFLPLEFFLTEVFYTISVIPELIGTTFIFLLVLIFSLFDWGKILKTKKSLGFVFLFYLICGLVYLKYRSEKLLREYLPKIYETSQSSGIQAEKIEVKGVNFAPTFKKGRVLIGEEELNIVRWSEKLIVAEIPVPKKFGSFGLLIERWDGKKSNVLPFEIRDPSSLRD